MIRCKFTLQEVTERMSSVPTDDPDNPGKTKWVPGRTWDAKFTAVSGEENKAFWHASPSGELVVRTVKVMPLTIGQAYYLDISPA